MTKENKTKTKPEIQEELKETKMALKILKETMELNDAPSLKAWLCAFHSMIAVTFCMRGMTYEDYCEHMEVCKRESKSMWE